MGVRGARLNMSAQSVFALAHGCPLCALQMSAQSVFALAHGCPLCALQMSAQGDWCPLCALQYELKYEAQC